MINSNRSVRRSRSRRPPCPETLEGRALLSTGGADYVLSGTQWPNPSAITYSIAPDGVSWNTGGTATNNLNAVFNALFGPGVWEREIARALATWEDVANINIIPVGETGQWPINATGQTQNDSRFGDIRFGGENLNNSYTLAQSYDPPMAGSTNTVFGNVEINTAQHWAIGSTPGIITYDLYSVMLHETGLTLGLWEPPPGGDVVMNTVYGGVRAGLMPGDIAGIQAIYGARTPDPYQAAGQGTSTSNAVDLTSALGGSLQATLTNTSLSSIGDAEYFSVIAPSNSGGTLSVTATAAGVSLLSPAVGIYNASGQLLASASNPNWWSDAMTAHASGIVPGQRYYIKVTGATSDAFAAGAYHLQLSFPNGSPGGPQPTQTGSGPIVAIYEEVLGRAPTTQEEATWNQELQSGASPQQLTLALYQSPEHQTDVINGLFEKYLNRPADPTAVTVFSGWLDNGASPDDIALALVTSPEFSADYSSNASFLTAAYHDILSRAPDPSGQAVFTQWLNQGATRSQVAQSLFVSTEHRTLEVQVAYQQVLGRVPDSSGAQYFLNVLQTGQGNLTAVYVDLLLSDENMQRVGY